MGKRGKVLVAIAVVAGFAAFLVGVRAYSTDQAKQRALLAASKLAFDQMCDPQTAVDVIANQREGFTDDSLWIAAAIWTETTSAAGYSLPYLDGWDATGIVDKAMPGPLSTPTAAEQNEALRGLWDYCQMFVDDGHYERLYAGS